MSVLKSLGISTLAAVVMAAPAVPVCGQEDVSFATVHLADETSLPLRSWELSYEFLSWAKGTPRFQAQTQSSEAQALWVEKKTYPVAGHTLEIRYDKARGTSAVKELLLVAGDGKTKKLKTKPPHRNLLAPGLGKKVLLAPQSLDLKGETLTGTKRSFCLLSYTSLVECPSEPSHQVTKIEFQ